MPFSYKQPVKNVVRERFLSAAVKSLSSRRRFAPVVQPAELSTTLEYANDILKDRNIERDVAIESSKWKQLYRGHVRPKSPGELRVLYLCGPEPSNDLQVLLQNGVIPENVWAVESAKEDIGLAVKDLSSSSPGVRFHPGDLGDLLAVYPGRFDIVYYDACGSLFRNGVIDPLLVLFREARLEPLSVLITNFAEVPKRFQGECATVLSSYFRYRYCELPRAFWDAEHLDPAICEHDDTQLEEHITAVFEPFYSDFISRLINDLARYWIPNCRALALKAISENYLADAGLVESHLVKARDVPVPTADLDSWTKEIGDFRLCPSSYPLLSFYEAIKKNKHPFASKIGGLRIGNRQIDGLLAQATLLERVIEGHWPALGLEMARAIALSWFDVARPFSCDAPLPNLVVNSLLGIYGYPAFVNARRCKRVSYTAKTTKMFMDLFVLDQCRYYFDWFPTIHLAPVRFKSHAFQVVARCVLDRIGRMDFDSSSHPFRGAAVAPFGAFREAQPYNIPNRVDMTGQCR